MANLSRWFNYAKARLDAAIGQGHRDLDQLEAQREAELADKPWLRSSGDAPTFDEAKARIEWEAEQAALAARRREEAPDARGTDPDSGRAPAAGTGPADGPGAARGPQITSPEERAAAADAASARLELEARERESAARLEAIRAELGIEPPAQPPVDEA